jgi:hypothetical protein
MGTNKFIQYGTGQVNNTYTDQGLVELSSGAKEGIPINSVAFSNILNALMRQLTFTNKALGDLVAEKTSLDIDSTTTSVSDYKDGIELAIENIAKEVSNINDTASSLFSIGIKFWVGTETDYNSISTKNSNVLYIIT